MTKRRLSQAISEGDGISVIVGVESADAARDAEAAGAEGVLVSAADNLAAVRAVTELPILVVHDPERPAPEAADACIVDVDGEDRKSTRLNSSHANISYAVFCLKKKKKQFSFFYFIKKKINQIIT